MMHRTGRIERFFTTPPILSSRRRRHASGRLSRIFRRTAESVAFTSTRAYGMFFLVYGLLTVLLCFVDAHFKGAIADSRVVIMGLICTLISMLFLPFEKAIYVLFQQSKLLHSLVFDFFCLPIRHKSAETKGIHPVWFALLGVVLTIVGYLTSPLYVALGIAVFVLIVCAMSAPELPFFLTLLLFPYLALLPHASVILAALTLLATVSYLRKAITGNRRFSFTPYDIPCLLFGLLLLISGIVHGAQASTDSGLLVALFVLGFPLSSNLIANRRLSDGALGAVAVSSVPAALLAIYQAIVGVDGGNWLDPAFIGKLTARVTATFGNPNIYAVFLLVALMFSLALTVERQHPAKRCFFLLCTLLNAAALVLTWSRGAWVAAILGVGLCLALCLRRHAGVLVSLLLLLPCAAVFIPEMVVTRLLSIFNLSDSTVVYRFSIWRSSLAMLRDHALTGIGVGADNFSEVFSQYAEAGVTAPHSHNLFLQLACEGGVLVLLLFVLLLVLRALHLLAFARYMRTSSVHTAALFSTAALFCLLVFGIADFPFTNPMMYYLFFTVFGIGCAALRIAKGEKADRDLFYTTDMGSHTAEISVDLDE